LDSAVNLVAMTIASIIAASVLRSLQAVPLGTSAAGNVDR
jgi:hypothetical protein